MKMKEGISHVSEEGGNEAVGDPESYGKDFELHTQNTSKLWRILGWAVTW